MRKHSALFVSAVVLSWLASGEGRTAAAVDVPWTQFRPTTTGIPGEEVRLMAFDPQGNLWVGARWTFQGVGSLAMMPAAEVPYTPLPGGGFDTGVWRVWSGEDRPIPSQFLSDIEFTPDGVVWLASDGGLTRLDPRWTREGIWRTYDAANSPLILDAVRSIELDSRGNVWLTNVDVLTSNGAVFKFDPAADQWTEYSVGNGLPAGWTLPWKNVNSVLVGADDHVFVTHSVLGGMAEFDGATWTLHETPGPLGGMLEDAKGNVWVTTADAGLYKWDGSRWTQWPTLGGTATITGLGLDREGVVYVSTWYGNVYKMIGGTTPQFFVNADNIPRGVIGRPDGDIWINNYGGNGTLGTVRHYDSAGTLLERFNTFNTGVPDFFIDRVQTDASGSLWFASGEGGLSRFDGQRWRNWGNHNDGSEPYPWAGNEPMGGFYIDRQGVGWMGGNGIGRWSPETGSFSGFWNWQNNPGMDVTLFTAFAEDAAGRLFAATTYGEVFRFDGSLWVQEPVPLVGYTSTFAWLQADGAGRVYAALPYAVHRWDGTTWSELPQPSPSFFELGGINCMTIGPDGVSWIGTNMGLVRWDGSRFTLFDTSNSPLPAKQVMGVDVRPDGTIAVSSMEFGPVTPFPNGVSLIQGNIANPASWATWQYGSSPLPHYQLGMVEFDPRGNLWVSAVSEGAVRIRTAPMFRPAVSVERKPR
jgi:ligand-binding sensor domain-containing protein